MCGTECAACAGVVMLAVGCSACVPSPTFRSSPPQESTEVTVQGRRPSVSSNALEIRLAPLVRFTTGGTPMVEITLHNAADRSAYVDYATDNSAANRARRGTTLSFEVLKNGEASSASGCNETFGQSSRSSLPDKLYLPGHASYSWWRGLSCQLMGEGKYQVRVRYRIFETSAGQNGAVGVQRYVESDWVEFSLPPAESGPWWPSVLDKASREELLPALNFGPNVCYPQPAGCSPRVD